MSEVISSNEGFAWDDTIVPEDFFNDSPEDLERQAKAENVIAKIESDDEPEEGTKPEKSMEQLADELFTDEDEGSADIETVEDNAEDSKAPVKDKTGKTEPVEAATSSTVSTLNFLKEKGYLDFELEEGQELTDELAEELMEDKLDESIDARLEELFTGLPQVVKDLVTFTKNGGDYNEFLAAVSKGAGSISANMDLSVEANQETVVRTILKEDGYDDEYIDTQLEFLKDSGKLATVSKKQYDVWSKNNEDEQNELLQEQQEAMRVAKENERKAKAKLTTTLANMEDVSGLKLSRADKKEMPSYFHDKNIKLQNGSSISSFHKDLYEALANETTALQLGKLLRTRAKDGTFDFSKIEANGKTKLTQTVQDNIRRNNSSTPIKSTSSGSRKELADYFN